MERSALDVLMFAVREKSVLRYEKGMKGHPSPNMPVFLDLPGGKRELVFVQALQRHNTPADTVAVTGWPAVLGKQQLNLHGPACAGRVTDLINT